MEYNKVRLQAPAAPRVIFLFMRTVEDSREWRESGGAHGGTATGAENNDNRFLILDHKGWDCRGEPDGRGRGSSDLRSWQSEALFQTEPDWTFRDSGLPLKK